MTARDIFGIIAVIAEIFVLLVLMYYRARGNVYELVAQFIALAEQTGKPGPEKMDLVVENLYEYLPIIFHGILSRERLRAIAQYVYDWMKAYALEYLESKAGAGHPPDGTVCGQYVDVSENNETPGEEDDGLPGAEDVTEGLPEEGTGEEPEEEPQEDEAAEEGEPEDGFFAEECGVVPEIVEDGE